MEVIRGWQSMGAWTSTTYTFVQGVFDVAEDAMESFAEDVVEGLVEDAEVTISKTGNLLQILNEGATFSQEREETIDDSERWKGVAAFLPVVKVD